jgi:hypothetical protein
VFQTAWHASTVLKQKETLALSSFSHEAFSGAMRPCKANIQKLLSFCFSRFEI